jgi:hypothetical protein
MRPVLLRLAEAEPSAVKDYLASQQIPPDIADWKYFDSRFNRGRDRGFVCVKDDKVCGFFGLIPFRARKDGRVLECAWSCDWSVDASQVAGGMGIMLVKRAKEAYDAIFNVGGNENTRRLFPRLADRTVWDAGMSLALPLRLGPILAKLAPAFLQPFAKLNVLHKIPLKWVRTSAIDHGIRIEPGVPKEIAPLLEDSGRGAWCPLYDHEYVHWQLEACPALTCWSGYIPAPGFPRAAAIIWRSTASTDFWRLALLGAANAEDECKLLLARMIQFAYQQDGAAVFAITSHLDQERLRLLTAQGFLRRRGRIPFYGLRGRDANLTFDEFGVLSFLDADMAYRF